MSRSKISINRRLLQGIGSIWLFSISRIGLTTTSQVTSVRIWSSYTYVRVMLESNSALDYKKFILLNPNRAVFDFKNINLNSMLKGIANKIRGNNPFIKTVRVGQFNPRTVRVVFEFKRGINLHLLSLSLEEKFKKRLVMDFFSRNITNIHDPLLTFFKAHNKENLKYRKIQQRFNSMGRKSSFIIMLDPGHGGEDPGAIGKNYAREKDLVLQIALHLKTLIEKENNMRVYMTRSKDIFVPLQARIAKAKKQHADLFISIHADAFTSSRPNGSSIFALSKKGATSTAAKYLANEQNSSSPLIRGMNNKSGDCYLDRAMFDMIQSQTINDSLKFGKEVLFYLRRVNKLHKRNIEQAGFAVLKTPDIPSILIETAFISNSKEEKKLKTVKFQRKIAESIFFGIKSYLSIRQP